MGGSARGQKELDAAELAHAQAVCAVLLGQLELTQKGFIVYLPTLFEFILCFWATPHPLWDLRFLTKDGTQAPSSESAESSPLDHLGMPMEAPSGCMSLIIYCTSPSTTLSKGQSP